MGAHTKNAMVYREREIRGRDLDYDLPDGGVLAADSFSSIFSFASQGGCRALVELTLSELVDLCSSSSRVFHRF